MANWRQEQEEMAKRSENKKRQVATRLRRKFQVETPILNAVIDTANMYSDWTPKQVYEQVKGRLEADRARFKAGEVKRLTFKGNMCSLRSVERIVQMYRLEADAWSIKDNPGEDSLIILTVLRNVILCTEGKKRHLSTDEADYALRLTKTLPRLTPWEVWQLVRVYLLAEAKGESTEELDNFLAFRTWPDQDYWIAHDVALEKGWVKQVPLAFFETPLLIPSEQMEQFLRRGFAAEKVAGLFGMPILAVTQYEEMMDDRREKRGGKAK
jgi:hypothetical protein